MFSKHYIVAFVANTSNLKCRYRAITQLKKVTDSIIVCDDGSSDMTGEISEKLGAIVVKHEKNMGYGGNAKNGLNAAMENYDFD